MKQMVKLSVLTFLAIPLCAFTYVPFNISKAPQTIRWFVVLDVTRSIPEEKFMVMRDKIIPELVLSRIKNNDEIHLISLDDNPEDDIKIFEIKGGKTGLKQEALKLWDALKQVKQNRAAKVTNFGGVLRYMADTVNVKITERKRINQNGPGPINIAVIISDGAPTGKQSVVGEPPQEPVHLWVFGIDTPDQKTATHTFFKKAGFEVTSIPYGYWERDAKNFAKEFGRSQVVPILRALYSNGKDAGPAGSSIF